MSSNTAFIKRASRTFISAGLMLSSLAIAGIPYAADAAMINRQLEFGMTGSDVSALQTFLAQDVSIYPQGVVSGYFGYLTKAAVSNFQSRNDLPAVGRVGPMTLPILNLQMSGGSTYNTAAPIITSTTVNASKNGANIKWTTNESAKGALYYSSTPLTVTEDIHSIQTNGNVAVMDANFSVSQNIVIEKLDSNTTYYYMIHTTDQSGNVTVSWPTTFKTLSN